MSSSPPPPSRIPLLLLKTQSHPTDPYDSHFSTSSSRFNSSFVPVLEHTPNVPNLARIKTLLRERRLSEEFGGCIFTSQRAVEGFARVVGEVDAEYIEDGSMANESPAESAPTAPMPLVHPSTPFPLYVVGPATALSLRTLLRNSPLLTSLHCHILGAQTGNGESLAHFILKHYNHAHYQEYFALYEAPRLPFVPLVGMGGSQYSKLKLGEGDRRVRKRGLLFLVGEVRRDVIPRLLGDGGGVRERRIEVEEVEVYSTIIRDDFEDSFRERIEELNRESHETIVVVVFSPGGCEAMLRVIGSADGDGDDDGDITKRRTKRSTKRSGLKQFVVAAIGPTTRDYLKETFGFEVDVTARKPSPEGVSERVEAFLRETPLYESLREEESWVVGGC